MNAPSWLEHLFSEPAYWRDPDSEVGTKAQSYGWDSSEARSERLKVICRDALRHGRFDDLAERLERAK